MNIFKINYYWYEGEQEKTLLIKDVRRDDFEKDITEAKAFAENLKGIKIQKGEYIGKGYKVECLPEFYEQMLWFLIEKKKYKRCEYDKNISYIIDDDSNKKIEITRSEKRTKMTQLK